MSNLLINDLSVVEEVSEETATSIHGGRYRQLREVRELEASAKMPEQLGPDDTKPGGDSGGLYPGLGNQADNETPIFRLIRFF